MRDVKMTEASFAGLGGWGWSALSLRVAVDRSDSGKNEEFQLLSHAEVVRLLRPLLLAMLSRLCCTLRWQRLATLDYQRPDACVSSHAGGQAPVHHKM